MKHNIWHGVLFIICIFILFCVQSATAQTATPTPSPTITPTSSISPTATISPTVTVTPTIQQCDGQDAVCIDLYLRLQGILQAPQSSQNGINVRVSIDGDSVASPVSFTTYMTAYNNGVWYGRAVYDLSVLSSPTASSNFKFSVKPPKHLKRIVCHSFPVEYTGGEYDCSGTSAYVSLSAGVNELDFSRIYFLAGDLPTDGSNQDGVIDSTDLVYLRKNILERDYSILTKGDLNMDGIIDTQDFSLAIYALTKSKSDQSFD